MKKILTLAIVAFLLGGLSFNASAQTGTSRSIGTAESRSSISAPVDWDKTLDEFDQAVAKCVTLYQNMQKNEKTAKENQKEFQISLTKAEKLKTAIDKEKNKLSKVQGARFEEICSKLQVVYEKR